MTARLWTFFAVALLATAKSVSFLAAQADKPLDPKELAVVQQIRARIEEQTKKTAGPPAAYKVTIPNTTVTYAMVPIRGGEFRMGAAGQNAKADEQPQHSVKVDAFWMQAHEVTWDAYLLFMFADQANERAKPDAIVDALSRPTAPYVEMSFGRGLKGFPAISMTQHAANKFAEWLSAKTGEYYRLPTEAEWEYACRAGTPTGIPSGSIEDYAWHAKNSAAQFMSATYHNVGTKKPNAWGLYDMLGNVMEWTLDQYAPYPAAAQTNPWTKSTTSYPHAVRGGSWNNDPSTVTCTARVASDASWKRQDPQLPKSLWYMTDAQWLGFRLVRPAALPSAEDMYRAWNNGVALDPY
ncbi:MAG TPA: SUMF1/EgtB/PvdO family nonheme iron enzyme [Vicinamibacterales bacterium]|jgi:formylglycine-generating enzyme required for sulfatase activity|nr:SUMF1/EgtB/PvdO family nonheme iron enzyme [Vicinamibacterales bacterium]